MLQIKYIKMHAVIAAVLCGSLIAEASKTFIFENDNHTLNANITKDYITPPELIVKDKDPAINDISFGPISGIVKVPLAQKKIDLKFLERNKSSESVFPAAGVSFSSIPFDDRNIFDKSFRRSSALDFIVHNNKHVTEYQPGNKSNTDSNHTKTFQPYVSLSPFDYSNFSKICENDTCRDYKVDNKLSNDEYVVVMKNLFSGRDRKVHDVNKITNVLFTRRPKAFTFPLENTNTDELVFKLMRNQLKNEIDRLTSDVKSKQLLDDVPSNLQKNGSKLPGHVDLTRAHLMPMPVSCPAFRMFGLCNQPHVISLPPVIIKIPITAEINIQGANLSFGDKLGIKMKKLLTDEISSVEY